MDTPTVDSGVQHITKLRKTNNTMAKINMGMIGTPEPMLTEDDLMKAAAEGQIVLSQEAHDQFRVDFNNMLEKARNGMLNLEQIDAIEKAHKDYGKLTKKKVMVTRDGKTFEKTVYVSQDKDIPKDHGHPSDDHYLAAAMYGAGKKYMSKEKAHEKVESHFGKELADHAEQHHSKVEKNKTDGEKHEPMAETKDTEPEDGRSIKEVIQVIDSLTDGKLDDDQLAQLAGEFEGSDANNMDYGQVDEAMTKLGLDMGFEHDGTFWMDSRNEGVDNEEKTKDTEPEDDEEEDNLEGKKNERSPVPDKIPGNIDRSSAKALTQSFFGSFKGDLDPNVAKLMSHPDAFFYLNERLKKKFGDDMNSKKKAVDNMIIKDIKKNVNDLNVREGYEKERDKGYTSREARLATWGLANDIHSMLMNERHAGSGGFMKWSSEDLRKDNEAFSDKLKLTIDTYDPSDVKLALTTKAKSNWPNGDSGWKKDFNDYMYIYNKYKSEGEKRSNEPDLASKYSTSRGIGKGK